MKHLILILLFPIITKAQVIDYAYVSNAFGGNDTIQTFKFYKTNIDTTIIDFPIVRSLFYQFSSNQNTKTAELIVDQSGMSDPTYLTVSSDIGTIDITYDAVGTYLFEDRISSFDGNKTFLFFQNRNGANNYTIDYEYVDADTLRIYTKSGGTLTNGILNKCFIKLITFK
jgi:hypothetical protein